MKGLLCLDSQITLACQDVQGVGQYGAQLLSLNDLARGTSFGILLLNVMAAHASIDF